MGGQGSSPGSANVKWRLQVFSAEVVTQLLSTHLIMTFVILNWKGQDPQALSRDRRTFPKERVSLDSYVCAFIEARFPLMECSSLP